MKESTRVLVALGAAHRRVGVAHRRVGQRVAARAADAIAPIGTLWVNAIRMTVIPLVVSLLITGVASASRRQSDRPHRRADAGRVRAAARRRRAIVVMPLAPALFALLPPRPRRDRALPAGAAEAARQLAAERPGADVRRVAHVADPVEPDRRRGERRDDAARFSSRCSSRSRSRAVRRRRARRSSRFFRALGDAMLMLVRWVVLARADRRLRARAAARGARRRRARGRDRLLHRRRIRSRCLVVTLLLYPVVAIVGRHSDAALRARRASGAAHRVQLELVDRVAAGAGRERRAAASRCRARSPASCCRSRCRRSRSPAPVSWTIGALFVGWFYGVPLHAPSWRRSPSPRSSSRSPSPGIPRGAFIMLTPLFLAIGLPAEGIGILIAVDAIPDTFATVLNVTGDLAAAAIVARGERATADVGHPVGLDEFHSMSSVSIHAPTNL